MSVQKILKSRIRRWIPQRKPDSHKGDFGRVLILAGSKGMTGAASLCAWGALRGGAGLVTVGVPESQQPIIAKKIRPESMTIALPETAQGSFSEKAVAPVVEFIKKRKISSLAIGPGLSRNDSTGRFVRKLLSILNRDRMTLAGIVLDADGFLALKLHGLTSVDSSLAGRGAPVPEAGLKSTGSERSLFQTLNLPIVVTPHPGEMAQFCGVKVSAVQSNRIQYAQKFARLNHVTCLLKGQGTVITDGEKSFINSTGNPGMATGGSGDVLTGLIAALIGQMRNQPLLIAASTAVFIHGLAGDIARKEKTEIGMIAGDIAEKIPAALKSIL